MKQNSSSQAADRAEGDINHSLQRKLWQKRHLDAATRGMLDEDAKWFLHQSLSTPCLNALAAFQDDLDHALDILDECLRAP